MNDKPRIEDSAPRCVECGTQLRWLVSGTGNLSMEDTATTCRQCGTEMVIDRWVFPGPPATIRRA